MVKVETKVDNLESWQESQNGAIHRVEKNVGEIDKKFDKKFDNLTFLIIAQLCATVLGAAGIILVGK